MTTRNDNDLKKVSGGTGNVSGDRGTIGRQPDAPKPELGHDDLRRVAGGASNVSGDRGTIGRQPDVSPRPIPTDK
jgi:hypothetical protein